MKFLHHIKRSALRRASRIFESISAVKSLQIIAGKKQPADQAELQANASAEVSALKHCEAPASRNARDQRRQSMARWGLIVSLGAAAGVATGLSGGLGAGLVAGILVAAAIHQMLN